MQATNPSPATSDRATLANLNNLADATLAADRAYTRALIPAAAETATAEAAATPCPPWCVIDHTDRREDGDYHYGEAVTAGPVWMTLDIDSADTATIALRTPGAPGENLDLDEVDTLIARLTELRPVLADTITQRGGAA